jgi:hypothetical protein
MKASLLLGLLACWAGLSVAVRAQTTAVTLRVDARSGLRTINPLIYGLNYASTAALSDLNVGLNRQGGNLTTRYNWKNNAENHGLDFYFESIANPSSVPGEVGDTFIGQTKAAGAQPMVSIPMIGWAAKLGPNRGKLASFSQQKYGAQTQRRQCSGRFDLPAGLGARHRQPLGAFHRWRITLLRAG